VLRRSKRDFEREVRRGFVGFRVGHHWRWGMARDGRVVGVWGLRGGRELQEGLVIPVELGYSFRRDTTGDEPRFQTCADCQPTPRSGVLTSSDARGLRLD
jgi:hypothetical protein